ncbi:sugar phosphate isomerase/epimerase family protein [Anaeromicropila populeti]|uniref:Sugar phosphate isomerase/epimerase n=1 Tax=Anaeromicropila populeti TaxID=37658 RepID=A0A1I6IN31_9FIRM|nr:sugar phosphate isomerase/epimerase [Anaeromicropila populeti]SFR68118.1 Sugar phosphate isomerase/epimerase [Anaeromicropila populeti]
MQLAVFYHHIKEAALQTGLSELEVLRQAKAFGITQLEFDVNDLKNEGNVIGLLEESGFSVSSIYGFYDFGKKQDGAEGFELIDKAVTFGSKNIMIIPGFYESRLPEGREAEEKRMVLEMAKMCDYAGEKGITPTIEDFDDDKSPIATAEQMKRMTEVLNNLKITFDTGNFIYSAQSEVDAYDILKGKIVHVHCKDRALKGTIYKVTTDNKKIYPAVVGSGCIAMEIILKKLKADGYEGTLTIEHFDASDYLAYMKQSAEWLIRTWRNCND